MNKKICKILSDMIEIGREEFSKLSKQMVLNGIKSLTEDEKFFFAKMQVFIGAITGNEYDEFIKKYTKNREKL